MTDKAKILAEIERLKNDTFNGGYDARYALDLVTDFINSLSEEPVIWHSAYELSKDVKMNKGYYHIVERLCLCVNHKGDAAIGWIEVDGDDVACCSPHLISTWLLANVYYYAYIDELFPQKLTKEITKNIMNDKSY